MDLGARQESSITMPISLNYGSIHESSKFRMMGGGVGIGGSNGPVPNSTTAAPPRPPPPPEEMNARHTAAPAGNSNISTMSEQTPAVVTGGLPPSLATKKPVKFRECLKNHAASIGGHALDGCGEFMPSGEEGSLEALKCAACGCHRNFHRREVEGELPSSCFCYSPRSMMKDRRRFAPLALPPHTPLALSPSPAVGPGAPPRTISQQPQHANIMALSSSSPTDCDDQDFAMMQQAGGPLHHHLHSPGSLKKRFRTKFTSEQKDKMSAFAEKLGWRIQKHDETAVHQFCADVGVKRHVFKVWMHNNKNTFGKKPFPNEAGVAYLDNGGSPTNSSGMQP